MGRGGARFDVLWVKVLLQIGQVRWGGIVFVGGWVSG